MYRSLISRLPETPSEHPPLLFVHGAWHGAWCWDEYVLPWFAAQGFEAHALDLRGHGASDNDRPLRRTRVDHYVDDLVSTVAGLGRAPILVGHSLGGLVVQRYLEGEDVPGAILVAPVPVGGAIGVTMRMIRHHPLVFLKANLTLRLWPIVATPLLARDHLFGMEMSEPEAFRHFARIQDESYLTYLEMMTFRRPRPDRITVPMMVIAAEHDGVFTLGEMRRTAGAYGVEPTVIRGGAHDLMLDARWMEMTKAIRAWVENLEMPAGR